MVNVGRPRAFQARRTSSGRTDPHSMRRRQSEDRLASIRARAQHTGLTEAQAAEQRAGSPEGRLEIKGVLDHAQATAISTYRRAVVRYDREIGCPRDPSGEWERSPGRGMAGDDDELERDDRGHCVVDRNGRARLIRPGSSEDVLARLRLEQARAALNAAGTAARNAVDIVIRHNAEPSPYYYGSIQVGSSALARHYRIEGAVERPKLRVVR
jgi:hypothetical protein